MLKIRCPKCRAFVDIFDRSFKVNRDLKRKCITCEEDIELSNPIVVGAIGGLLLGGIFNLLLYCDIHLLLRFAVVFLTMIFVPVVMIKVFGRWHIYKNKA